MKLNKKIIKIMEDEGWKIYDITKQDDEYYVEIENYSPEGEDIVETVWFDGTNKGFIEGVRKSAESFDADEHAELWIDSRGKNGVPNTIRELLDDADAIKDMLIDIADKLEEINI